MTAIILAGGRATRMKGRNKAFLKIGRQILVNRQIKLLRKIFQKIILVTNSPFEYRNLRGVKVITDVIPHLGSLGGVYSGLLASQEDYNFIIACDMPFIDTEIIKFMYRQSKGYEVVVPYVDNKYEPLFTIYSKDCLPAIKRLLERGIFKISKFFPQVKVKRIGKKEVLRFGNPREIFANINTPGDLGKFHV